MSAERLSAPAGGAGQLQRPGMSFAEWLARYRRRDSPLGDLARDTARVSDFPTDNDREAILAYMRRRGAYWAAVLTFKQAWNTYQAYLRRHPELEGWRP